MQYDNKTTRSVADAAAKIMSEKLHPNQQKLDVHEPEKDELTAQDFKKLRAMKKEETEQLQEYETDKNGRYVHKGTYGGAKGSEYGSTEWDKEEKMKDEKQKPARRKYGARQNYKRSTRVNESFSDLVESLQGGLKNFEQQLQEWKSKKVMKEEPDNETFTKEVEKQKAKAAGTASDSEKAKVADAATQAVTVQKEETEIDEINGVQMSTIDERSLTEPEMNEETKKEAHLKKMKEKAEQQRLRDIATARARGDLRTPGKSSTGKVGMSQPKGTSIDVATGKIQPASHLSVGKPSYRFEEVDIININGVKMSNIEERTLSEPEMKKREEVVKSMKKKMAGFKERYGDRAKEVMYATATKVAKKD